MISAKIYILSKILNLEQTYNKNGSTWSTFLWQKFCQNHFGHPNQLKIHIRVKYQSFAPSALIGIFKQFGCPKWFWQQFCYKKAGQVEPFLS